MHSRQMIVMDYNPRTGEMEPVEDWDPSQPPDHPAFDDPAVVARWRRIYDTLTKVLCQHPDLAHYDAMKKVLKG